jgi:hypothetical protein
VCIYVHISEYSSSLSPIYILTEMRLRSLILSLLALSSQTLPTHSVRVSILDSITAFPFIRNADTPTTVMRWDSGGTINLINECKLIRITRRGVRCIASDNHIIPGWEKEFDQYNSLARIGGTTCLALNTALCVTPRGDRYFPVDKVYVSEKSISKCEHGQGRLVVPDQLYERTDTTNTTKGDDVSLCDIIDRNVDVVYDPVNNRIYTKQLTGSLGLYGFMSFLILVVVVLSAEALADESRSYITHNIIAWVLLTTTSIFALAGADGRMHTFVTVEDRSFLYISSTYVVLSTIYWISSVAMVWSQTKSHGTPPLPSLPSPSPSPIPSLSIHGPATQRDGINAMLGSVHLATCTIYGTADNTYVSGFFFCFLFRCMQKLHSAHHEPEKWSLCANTVLLLDVAYTVTIFHSGILAHYSNQAEIILYAAAQYVVCDTIAFKYVLHTFPPPVPTPTLPPATATASPPLPPPPPPPQPPPPPPSQSVPTI